MDSDSRTAFSTEITRVKQELLANGISEQELTAAVAQILAQQNSRRKKRKSVTFSPSVTYLDPDDEQPLLICPGFLCQFLLIAMQVVIPAMVGCAVFCYMYPRETISYMGWDGYGCLLESNEVVDEIVRPEFDCDICKDIKQVAVVHNITREEFEHKFAYTGVPVLVKNATTNWKALDTFSFNFLKDLYQNTEGALKEVDENCQFFPYKTEFLKLEEAFEMSDARAEYREGERPWYFGWSNCHEGAAAKLREHYERPYFLPQDADTVPVDWIFMGGPGVGALLHIDSVDRPSWQAQIQGTKTWTLIPSPECDRICAELKVTVEAGDIIVLDTNQWYHSTFVHPGKISIVIGSEFS